jgi:hypothetical protein
MVPLIDVSLVFVVMLLLATPLAFEHDVASASRTGQKAEKTEKSERARSPWRRGQRARHRQLVARRSGHRAGWAQGDCADHGLCVPAAGAARRLVDVLTSRIAGAADISVIER